MKRIFTIAAALLMTASVWAQAPEKMSYQAVVRDAGNALVTTQAVGMQISILQGGATGTAVYVETQTPTTNANGLVSLEIGTGTLVSGNFTAIDWANDTYFIKTETDPTGGTNYTIAGTSQLLSVPYALHAKTAEIVTETDPIYTGSEAASITASDITNLGNLSGTNTGDQDLSTLATKTALGDSTALVRSEIPDVSGFLTSETDPVYGSSVASGITGTDTTNWNNKLDTETDPTYTGSEAASITASDITNLGNLSGINTGDQDLSTLATKTALGDSTALVRSEIPDVSGFLSTETDPVYTTSQAANITATDITNLGNLSNINTGDQDLSTLATKTALGDSTAQLRSEIPAVADGSETQVTAGTNVSVTGSGTTASPYVVNATGATALAIGDSYQGGIIFWLDATGQHGLIAATADQSTGIQWYNGTYRYTGTTGDGLYAGSMNTAMIVATQMSDNQTGNFAAKVCADYSVTVGGVIYGDWYLPSKYELNLLYLQKAVVGGFASAYYWSSSEYSNNFAWYQNFDSGFQGYGNKVNSTSVRAVRAF